MKLASLKADGLDGQLVIVSRNLQLAKPVPEIAPTLQSALDRWASVAPALEEVSERLNAGAVADALQFDHRQALSPLPRCYLVFDVSNYVRHHELMSRRHNKPVRGETYVEPFGYQSGRGILLGAKDDISFPANIEMLGIDFEAEVAVITDHVPVGTSTEAAGRHVRLVTLMNDVSLRNMGVREMEKGFGLFLSKPVATFAPVAVTPDELGDAWDGDRIHLPLISTLNSQEFGRPNAGKGALFGFRSLVAYAAQTRPLGPGTIIGGGTVSNREPSAGSGCIAERRIIETIAKGEPETEYMQFGDTIRIEMFDAGGNSIFGSIDQQVVCLRR